MFTPRQTDQQSNVFSCLYSPYPTEVFVIVNRQMLRQCWLIHKMVVTHGAVPLCIREALADRLKCVQVQNSSQFNTEF